MLFLEIWNQDLRLDFVGYKGGELPASKVRATL